ncbi:MAG: DNA polymerase I, partial [Planctomycetaceae bacterium]
MSDTLYLVDVYSLVFQVFHAIRQPMTGSRGQPTNAVFGFTRDLKYLLEQKQPTHLICAMDSPGPGVRGGLYTEYKANRAEMPEDLRPQVPMIFDTVEAFRVPLVSHAGWEADDVIATLTRQAVERGMEVRIVTGDKDARQLLGPKVQIYNVRKDAFLDETHLKEDWGVRPDQVIDFQALVGDSVDNVPGIPLVGPKKASDLLQKFGTLEDVLAHADDAPGKKLKENLKTYADRARMSRTLVTLNTDLPIEINWDEARVTEPNRERLAELFQDFGFRRFAEELRAQKGPGETASDGRTWETIDTPEKFSRWLKEFKKQKTFCVDLETTGLNAIEADIVGWAFCWEACKAYYLPVDGPPGQPTLDGRAVLDALRPSLEDPRAEVINQNIKYDMLVLKRQGVEIRGVGMDPMIGDYLLDAGARSHGLENLAQKHLGLRMIPITDLIGTGRQQKKMFEIEIDRAAEYASEDADIAWRLAECITAELKQQGLFDLYWNVERPLVPVLADMEFTGIRVDVDELKRQSEEITTRLDAIKTEIHQVAGREFNIDSPKQLQKILFEDLGLPVLKRTKTGASTDAEVLEKLATEHELPRKIIEHRHLAKLKGTYLDALPALVNPRSGRIHGSFNQAVASTGRLSSSEPNLQNIPIRTEEGRKVRRAFVPGEPDWTLVCADYSQIELRFLAHFSGDESLTEAFEQGEDIHAAVAADIFSVDPKDVTKDMRRVAKGVNFGIMYGQSPYGLSEVLGITPEDAARFIDAYFVRYAGVARFFDQVLKDCAETGYVKTILGRRRAITGVRAEAGRQKTVSERTAINAPIQGSAADLIKLAMINIHRRLAETEHPARMLLQIHDELV